MFYISWSDIGKFYNFNRFRLETWREGLKEVLMPFERRGFKPLKPTKLITNENASIAVMPMV